MIYCNNPMIKGIPSKTNHWWCSWISAELGTAAWHQCQKLLQQARPRLSLGLSVDGGWRLVIPISIQSTKNDNAKAWSCMAHINEHTLTRYPYIQVCQYVHIQSYTIYCSITSVEVTKTCLQRSLILNLVAGRASPLCRPVSGPKQCFQQGLGRSKCRISHPQHKSWTNNMNQSGL